MKHPYFVRSIFGLVWLVGMSWSVEALAQADATSESSSDAQPSFSSDWLYEQAWADNADNIVYSAAMMRQPIDMAATSVYVITDQDIARHGWRTLAEMLRHVPGVQTVMDESQWRSVSIRGLGGVDVFSSGIIWLQDGVPLNDAHTSGIYLDETYPIELIKRVEVVTGPGAAMYGNGAAQGVIQIFTKTAQDIDKYGEYRLSLQENLTFKGSAIAGYQNADFGILGHVSGNTTNGPGLVGNYLYNQYAMKQAAENVGSSLVPTAYRGESMISNSEKHWYDLGLKLNYKNLHFDIEYKDVYAGSDGAEYLENIKYTVEKITDLKKLNIEDVEYEYVKKYHHQDLLAHLSYNDTFGENLAFSSSVSYRLKRIKDYLVDADDTFISINTDGDTQKFDVDQFFHHIRGQAQLTWKAHETNTLTAGLVLDGVIGSSESNGEFIALPGLLNDGQTTVRSFFEKRLGHISQYDFKSFTPSLYIQDEQRLLNDRIILLAGLRFDADRVSSVVASYLPSAHVGMNAALTNWVTMRLGYGFTPKSPSLYQLSLCNLDGETEFAPEEHHKVELAFMLQPLKDMYLQFGAYYTHIEKPILMSYVPEFKINDDISGFVYEAKQDTHNAMNIFGVDLGLDASLGKNWNLYANYSLLYSDYKMVETSNDIQNDFTHHAKLGASYLNTYLTVDLAMFLVGGDNPRKSHFAWNHNNSVDVPIYALFQPQITVGLPANLGLMVQGSYAFSEGMTESPTYRYYYEKEGIPVSRYSVMLSLLYPFRK